MGVITIGSRLVRTFGEGKNLRRIVTECVDGKTYTRVLGADGKKLIDRVKAFKCSAVGNKKVLTTTKLRQDDSGVISKSVYDRVYNQNGSFLGAREVFTPALGRDEFSVCKSSVNSILFKIKHFTEGIVCNKQIRLGHAGAVPPKSKPGFGIAYNAKGLPLPYVNYSPGVNFDRMSLKEMRDWHVRNFPHIPYTLPCYGLEALDNREIGSALGMINDLDKFI